MAKCGNKSALGDQCVLAKRHKGRHSAWRDVAEITWQWSRHQTCHMLMGKPTEKPLTNFQRRMLDLLAHGYAVSAARYNYKAQEMRDMEDLERRGLARRQSPAPWNRAGAFVKP